MNIRTEGLTGRVFPLESRRLSNGVYTIVLAGGTGLGIILIPNQMKSMFGLPSQDPMISGVVGGVHPIYHTERSVPI